MLRLHVRGCHTHTKVSAPDWFLHSLWSPWCEGSHPFQGSQWRKRPEQMGKRGCAHLTNTGPWLAGWGGGMSELNQLAAENFRKEVRPFIKTKPTPLSQKKSIFPLVQVLMHDHALHLIFTCLLVSFNFCLSWRPRFCRVQASNCKPVWCLLAVRFGSRGSGGRHRSRLMTLVHCIGDTSRLFVLLLWGWPSLLS